MHNHFNQYLNIEKWIKERHPKVVVECGAGNGDLTRKLSSVEDNYGFTLNVISDTIPSDLMDKGILLHRGLSYEVLKKFPDESIDLCIIDTDHNYWTLAKELEVLKEKMAEGGLIALHDVETFYHDTGMALSYFTGDAYPQAEIEKLAPYGSLGDAMIEFLHLNNMMFKLLAYSPESHGGAIIERKTQKIFSLFVPGPGAVFAQPVKEEVNAGI